LAWVSSVATSLGELGLSEAHRHQPGASSACVQSPHDLAARRVGRRRLATTAEEPYLVGEGRRHVARGVRGSGGGRRAYAVVCGDGDGAGRRGLVRTSPWRVRRRWRGGRVGGGSLGVSSASVASATKEIHGRDTIISRSGANLSARF
jgi:hypothetical protein